MSIQVAFGTKNPDGTVSDAARERAIKIYEEYSEKGESSLPFPCIPKTKPNPGHNPNLRDREKYAAWHARWIDGTYKSILDSLDGAQSFVIPIFDPTGVAGALGLPIPDLDLAGIVASFAVPQAALPAILEIKPLDVPDFLSGLAGLINPQPPIPIPQLPPIPTLPSGLPLFGGNGIPGFPSLEGFNLALFNALPNAFGKLFEIIANPGWWASFTPNKLFEAACKAVQETMPPSETSEPSNYNANVATMVTLQQEAMGAYAAGKLIGATTLLRILGEKKGYLVEKTAPNNKDAEAALNGLYRLQSNELNMAVLFPQREMSYGDQFTIETIQALAMHMYEDTSYREEGQEPLTLEIGNITGKEDYGKKGKRGWRYNLWSKSHFGTAFDMAYPMKDENGSWISGVGDNNVSKGTEMGEKGSTPFKTKPPNSASNPYKNANGELAHDFPAMYEIGRWLFHDWFPLMISEGRFKPWDSSIKVVPYRTILIGENIYPKFKKWADENKGPNWNLIPKYQNGWKSNAEYMFVTEPAHDDHMHFAGQRTRVDPAATNELGKTVHLCSVPFEQNKKYDEIDKVTDDGKTYRARI